MIVQSDLSTVAPVYVADVDHSQDWHRRVGEAVFQYSFEAAGLVHMASGVTSAYPLCPTCECGWKGDGCWYCEEAA